MENNTRPIEESGETEFSYAPRTFSFENDIQSRRLTRGRVRWFDRDRGYGFLWEDGYSKDIFVHQSAIQVPGTKHLRRGQRVLFDWCKARKGICARNVLPIQERPEALERQRLRRAQKGDP